MAKRKTPEPVGDADDPLGMAVLLACFLQWMRVKNYSEETTLGRHGNLSRFIRWAEERGVVRPNEVSKPVLDRYQRYLYHFRKKNGDPLSFRTQHANLVAIKAWFKWLRATTISSLTRPVNWRCPSWGTACPSTS